MSFLFYSYIPLSQSPFFFNDDSSPYGKKNFADEKAMWYSFASLNNHDDNSHTRTESHKNDNISLFNK